MDSWEVTWQTDDGAEHRQEFRSYMDAWNFNKERLKGQGQVVLLTDRPLVRERSVRSEAEAARRQEGGRRPVRRRRSRVSKEKTD